MDAYCNPTLDRIGNSTYGWYDDQTMRVPGTQGLGRGIWKVQTNLTDLGRMQTHGEIIAVESVEMFENYYALSQFSLNAKVNGAWRVCAQEGEYCECPGTIVYGRKWMCTKVPIFG